MSKRYTYNQAIIEGEKIVKKHAEDLRKKLIKSNESIIKVNV